MSDITVIGIDLAKNVFQVHAEDAKGNKVFNKQFTRKKLILFMTQLPPCLVGMEACGSAHYWARKLKSMGHRIKLVNPRKVKAYVDRNKNDSKDAEAICEATRSNKVPSIAIKSLAQQQMNSLHRARSQVVRHRTRISNHLRSQLAEYGLVTRQGFAALKKLVLEVLAGEHLNLEASTLFVFQDMYDQWQSLTKRIAQYDAQVKRVAQSNAASQTLMALPGIGEISATAITAKVDDYGQFKKGSTFAAWLGLTPKEYASANRRYLGSISKQGDRYIRWLLIHGARTSIHSTLKKNRRDTAYHRWIHTMVKRVGKNKAAVALANKHARMIWAMMKHGRTLDLNHAESFV